MKIPVIEWFEKKQCDMTDMRQVEQSLLYKHIWPQNAVKDQ